MSTEVKLPDKLVRLRAVALAAGPAGLILGIILALILTGWNGFMQAYLYSFILWFALGLGSLALLMIHHLTAGAWSYVIQRILEAASRTLPLLFVLFIPILLGPLTPLHNLYHSWVHPENDIVASKTMYLNPAFWTLRSLGYFAIWIFLMYFYNRASRKVDETGDGKTIRSMIVMSGPAIILYALTMTFAALDWVMSLEPMWFSTIYGPLFWISQGLTVLAFSIIILSYLAENEPLAKYVTIDHYGHLANLMLAFTVLWAYMSFSQFLIIWSGNLPEEIHWYLARRGGGYTTISLVLMAFHFLVPLLILLWRRMTRNVGRLRVICFYLLAMRLLDVFWIVNPAFHHEAPGIYVSDVIVHLAVFVGMGGIWLWFFLGQLAKRPLLALNDPRLYDAVSHGHGHGEVPEHA